MKYFHQNVLLHKIMKKQLPDNIIKIIDERNLTPIPRWHFLLKRSVFWTTASLAVLLGGLAVSVIIFVYFDHDTEGMIYLNQGLVDNILMTIPYFWLVSLSLLIALTHISIRHTKGGYRFGVLRVAGIALIASLALGFVFDEFDVGKNINESLSESIPYYNSLVYTSTDEWSQPEKGLLGGTVLTVADTNGVSIRDFRKKEWRINFQGFDAEDISLVPRPGERLRAVGKDLGNNTFQAEQVFSWKK